MSFRSIVLLILVLLTAGAAGAQAPGGKSRTLVINKPERAAKLVDEFGVSNSEERSARFDAFFQEIAKDPGSTGYVFLFCGRKCRYDEIAAHMRGIEVKIALRRFDRSRLVIQDAGFTDSFRTQFWLVPEGACPPPPESSVHIRNVEFTKPGKYLMEPYDCCDDYTEVWKSLKP